MPSKQISSPDRESVERRRFLKAAAATGALAVTSSARAVDEPPAAEAKANAMPLRLLGKTGLRVPILEVGGTYRFEPRYVRTALDLGCNFFDTAASYVNGKSEETLGACIAKLNVRMRVTVVTKGHPSKPEKLAECIGESLGRLKFDMVDIYYLHNLSDVDVLKSNEWKAAAEGMKKAGKIRFFGFSVHNGNCVELLHQAAKSGWIDVIMLKYNFRSYGDAELNKAIDAAHKANIGLIAMKTQGAASSFASRVDPFKEAGYSRHQAVLKAVWKDERIASTISAMPSISVLKENASAATKELTAREQELLDEYAALTAPTYCHGGCGGCHRECESAAGRPLAIADTLRYLMYHDAYGRRAEAREKFSRLETTAVDWKSDDLARIERSCPAGVAVASLIKRANHVFGATGKA